MIHKRLVHKTVATGGRVYTAEVPVTQVVGASIVQTLEALEHKLQFGIEVYRFQKVGNLARDFIGSELLLDCACADHLLGIGFLQFLDTRSVSLVNE